MSSSSSSPAPGEVAAPVSERGVELRLVVHNISKSNNVGELLRSATAFGATEVLIVGQPKFNTFGAKGAQKHMRTRVFASLPLAKDYLVSVNSSLVGVEIGHGARSIATSPFTGSTAFLMGNEGSGLEKRHIDLCDYLVFIPQFGSGTASLNVYVAASIVMHRFAEWAGFKQREVNNIINFLEKKKLFTFPTRFRWRGQSLLWRKRSLMGWKVCPKRISRKGDCARKNERHWNSTSMNEREMK
jgi:tRNA(Leu) C34 or U34 (ribose-2'-O)-methylase TrmL